VHNGCLGIPLNLWTGRCVLAGPRAKPAREDGNSLKKEVQTKLDAVAKMRRGDQVFLNISNEKAIQQFKDNSIDLVLTSPPYNIGKSYEKVMPLDDYLASQEAIIQSLALKVKEEGNIAWQVGFTLDRGELVPLEYVLYPIFKKYGFKLRNRIVWTFGSGMHARAKYSGRHEVVMIWSKAGSKAYFDLDSVRVPQKYPEKRAYKGPNKGQLSGHPMGKNPGDVWDIPNVKAHHVEKTEHDCQFPIALAQRLIRSLSPEGGVVFDPYAGVATTNCAAALEGRTGIGTELDKKFFQIGTSRIETAINGDLKFRPIDKPIPLPKKNEMKANAKF
jgi:adenine-specific DNA-methyltransferase